MTAIEGIIGLAASLCAIIGTVILCARWLGRKFEHWTETMIDNSQAMRNLTFRVSKLEEAIRRNEQ